MKKDSLYDQVEKYIGLYYSTDEALHFAALLQHHNTNSQRLAQILYQMNVSDIIFSRPEIAIERMHLERWANLFQAVYTEPGILVGINYYYDRTKVSPSELEEDQWLRDFGYPLLVESKLYHRLNPNGEKFFQECFENDPEMQNTFATNYAENYVQEEEDIKRHMEEDFIEYLFFLPRGCVEEAVQNMTDKQQSHPRIEDLVEKQIWANHLLFLANDILSRPNGNRNDNYPPKNPAP